MYYLSRIDSDNNRIEWTKLFMHKIKKSIDLNYAIARLNLYLPNQ